MLAIGSNPAAASATVHLAEIGTTLISGLSHWKFGNVDWKVAARIGVPGAIGAILASGRLEPRKVIGSIDTSKFLVALAASLGFLFSLGSQGVNFHG